MRFRRRRKVYLDNLPKTHDVRFAVSFLLGLALLLGAVYAVGYLVAGDRMPNGTTVAGVDVGGMPPDRARTVLQEELAPRLDTPLEAVAAGRRYTIDPQAAGFTFDVDATVERALAGSPWDPRHMLHVLTGGGEVDPVITRDDEELEATLAPIATAVRQRPVDAGVSMRGGQPQIVFGEAGRRLDIDRSGDRLEAALLRGEDRARLVVVDVQPDISGVEATRFVDRVARPALATPVRLRADRAVLTVPPTAFGPALRVRAADGGLRLDVDARVLLRRSAPALRRLPDRPTNATLQFTASGVRVVPGSNGVTVTGDDLAGAVLRALTPPGPPHAARVRVVRAEPPLTTRELRRLKIREVVGQAEVQYDASSRLDLLVRASRQLDGELLHPGETLSFARAVGSVRARSVGSLLASATHLAAYRAGMAVPARSANRVYAADLPLGLDAVVAPPSVDLRLQNTSPYGVYVRVLVERTGRASGAVQVEMWSTQYWRVSLRTSPRYGVATPGVVRDQSRRCEPRAGDAGFSVDVTRTLRRPGERRTDETHSRYAPLDRVVCV